MQPRDLERLTNILLDEAAFPGELRDAAVELHEGLASLGGIHDVDPTSEDSRGTLLPGGKALSPLEAGRCLLDVARTTRFLRGLRDAIGASRALRPDRPVELLYAGCGPFATLAVPLTTRFSPDALRVTLIDVHERSLRSARRVVEALGLQAWIRDSMQADATRLWLEEASRYDVVVIETMQRGLATEPQVAVAWNLLSQLRDDVVLIPEAVTLGLCLADLGSEAVTLEAPPPPPPARTELGPVFELSAASIRSWGPFQPASTTCGSPVSLIVPRDERRGEHLVVKTRVRVRGAIVLANRDSGITWPYPVALESALQAGDVLRVRYGLQPPGLHIACEAAQCTPANWVGPVL